MQSTLDGELLGDCSGCRRSNGALIEQYAPSDTLVSKRKQQRFFDALADYKLAWTQGDAQAAEEARDRVEKLRKPKCSPCARIAGKMDQKKQLCKDWWNNVRKEECVRNDGCLDPHCVERGDEAWCVLTGDHIHTRKAKDEKLRKKYELGDYVWWARNGGVQAMEAEKAKGMNFRCFFCHMLQPTTAAANKCPDPETMPDGKRSGTEEERSQYFRKRCAKIRYPKHKFVDGCKLKIGKCAHCQREVKKGEEHAFNFDHIDERSKLTGRETLAGKRGGVAGLVGNSRKCASLDKIKDVLVKEMGKCQLLCRNCDHRKTHKYPRRH